MTDEVAAKVAEFFGPYPQRKFSKGQVLVQAGEEPAGIYYLTQGRVTQYDIASSGVQVVVNVFQPPAFFPMSWAINKSPNDYFFEAVSDVEARVAPADDVVAFVRREPEVLFNLLSRVYRGTDRLLRRQVHLMSGDAKTRLVYEILSAAYRFGTQDEAGTTRIPVKEGDLAKYTGLARETVNRAIQGLKAKDLVRVIRSEIVIPDLKKLEAELDPQA